MSWAASGSASFHTTRWSIVGGAGASDPQLRRAALETLCRTYWYPLYAFLRRKGRTPERAADLVQGLFAKVLERDGLGAVDEEGGRFRNWILTALVNHERDEVRRETAVKRGGGTPPIPVDVDEGERRFEIEDSGALDPERAFERAWAAQVLQAATSALERDAIARGRATQFAALRSVLTDDISAGERRALAEQLEMTPVALRVAIHRFKGQFRQRIADVVRQTVGETSDEEDELRVLWRAAGVD